MEELVNFMERVPKAQSATCWKNKEIQRYINYRENSDGTKRRVSMGGCGKTEEFTLENIYFLF